ncbi:H-hydrate dehydratase [Limtongia smithiae]|uniref:H-hydrate dehydratase n=1 Tax=Limtongia smithiae TaxID=1125753 RepID=UPI0034CEAA37
MAHVVCEKNAATVIKSYSPNLMVHPYMRDTPSLTAQAKASGVDASIVLKQDIIPRILAFLPRLHVVVIGPGLGRDETMLEIVRAVIHRAKELDLHIVIDADGLFLVQNSPDVISGYKKAVLTPNVIEFQRLCKALDIVVPPSFPADDNVAQSTCHLLAQKLNGPTIIAKGKVDYISNGVSELLCDMPGGLKRVGGQGDTLSGAMSTFLAWKCAYQSKLWSHDASLSDDRLMLLSAYGAAAVTRYSSRAAFAKYGRSMLASNLSEMIGDAYKDLFEDHILANI